MLKVELHAHASEDKEDNLSYTAKDLIDKASSLGYDVLFLTFHNKVIEGKFFEELSAYAKSKNILLFAGCEATIEGRHTLIYNITDDERKMINSFDDLRKLKSDLKKNGREVLIIASHPYFPFPFKKISLHEKLSANIDLFDAIEWSTFYTNFFNFNKRATIIAKKYSKPMTGGGDVHTLDQVGYTYTLIDADKELESIILAIKKGNIKVESKPLPLFIFMKITFKMMK
jgi:predicted metal-dependent phosphoesterase TrpH